MQDTLKRLRALQQELESLHQTTAKVLAESEELISQLEQPPAGNGRGAQLATEKRPVQQPRPSPRRARKRDT